jgi:hypothetical protein
VTWPIVLISVVIVLVVLAALVQRIRGDWGPGPAVIAVCILALGVITAAVLVSVTPRTEPSGRLGSPDATSPAPASSASAGTSAGPSASGPDPSGSGELILLRYEVALDAGTYRVFRVDAGGGVVEEQQATFDGPSRAPVDRVEAGNGQVHWRIPLGGLAGWSFIAGGSGPFTVREVLQATDGSLQYRPIPADA